MDSFDVDIDPEQLVLWVRSEMQAERPRFEVTASYGTEAREFIKTMELRFGDVESEDVSEITTVALLQIKPVAASDGWSIAMLVEDDIGSGLPEEGDAIGDEDIDLDTFYALFTRPDRGTTYLTATTDNPAAKGRLTKLLNDILKNRHPGTAAHKEQ